MNSLVRNLFAIFCLTLPITACSEAREPSDQSASKSASKSAAPKSAQSPSASPQRPTGRDFLVHGEAEAEGYGLYSYLLFGSPPTDATRDRYLQTIKSYLEALPEVSGLREYGPPSKLNVTYLPIKESAPGRGSAEWCLREYDYPRSQVLLRVLSGTHLRGPYIVSYSKPLSCIQSLSGEYIYQDLSAVPPSLVVLWVKEFQRRAAQERYWEEDSVQQFVVELRTYIGMVAEGAPKVRDGLKKAIAFIKQ